MGVTAALNNSGNGISLTDTSGGTGNLVISDTSGTGAAQLGIAGTFDNSKTTVQGANLQRKWVSPNMSLAKYNGGKGVSSGDFGFFLNALISFVVLAAVVYFFVVMPYTRVKEKYFPSPPPGTPEDTELLREIRDLLRAQAK